MIRVLHVNTEIDPRFGGPTAAFVGLTAAQARAGLAVSAVATHDAGSDLAAADALRSAGVSLSLVGPARRPLMRHPDLARTVAAAVAAADVVHVHAVWEEAQHLAMRSAAALGKPCVVRPAGMLTAWSLASGRLKKRLYLAWRLRRDLRRTTAAHFTTDLERRQTRAALVGLDRVPAIVEPNGVDLTDFAEPPPVEAFRAAHPRLAGRRVVAFLGRVFPGKGLEHLVPAIAQLVARGVDAALLVIGPDGDAAFRATLDSAVREHGLADRVVFAGQLGGREKVAALSAADLFCLPSDHENFGIAVVEALAAGVPAVVSPEVGVAVDVAAAGVGPVVPRDPSRLADELAGWLADESRRAVAAGKARTFARDRYDWAQIAARWVGHYEGMRRTR